MRLRELLGKLERDGKLVRIKREVSTELEIANVINALEEKPVLFEKVKGHDMSVFAGVCSDRDFVSMGFDTTRDKLLAKLVGAIERPVEPDIVGNAPCQEVVWDGVDLDRLPLLRHLIEDGGRYATSSIWVIRDPETGRNASYHRMMQTGKETFTARLIPGRQTRTTYDRTDGDLEAAVCIGSSMATLVAASLGPASGVDELSIANALEPTPLVKCQTKDLEVPADTEIVLECRVTKDDGREGPFMDLTETMDGERREPVVVVDRVTMRKDALYQALLPGKKEHKLLMGMPKEPTIFQEVSKVCRCTDVCVTPGGGSWLHAVVQIDKQHEDDGAKAIDAAFLGHGSLKHVWVVDGDVDPRDPQSVEWAVATRFQAGSDFLVMKDRPGSSLDPSGRQSPGKKALSDKAGFDATGKGSGKKFKKTSYGEVDIDAYLG